MGAMHQLHPRPPLRLRNPAPPLAPLAPPPPPLQTSYRQHVQAGGCSSSPKEKDGKAEERLLRIEQLVSSAWWW